jgi:hypothetical protein
VEVTTRTTWLSVRADEVTIDGITMEHAGNEAQTGALMSNGVSNVTVRNASMAHAHGVNVQFLYGSGHQLLDNNIHDAGQLGVSGYQVSHLLVQRNRIHDNNTSGFDANWEAGGLKVSSGTNVRVDDNNVYGNAGQGLWCDIGCRSVAFTQNRVHDNAFMGIVFEISNGASIVGNTLWNNGSAVADGLGSDIFVSSSSDAEVTGNTMVASSAHEILVISQDRPDAPSMANAASVSVHDNAVIPDAPH